MRLNKQSKIGPGTMVVFCLSILVLYKIFRTPELDREIKRFAEKEFKP